MPNVCLYLTQNIPSVHFKQRQGQVVLVAFQHLKKIYNQEEYFIPPAPPARPSLLMYRTGRKL